MVLREEASELGLERWPGVHPGEGWEGKVGVAEKREGGAGRALRRTPLLAEKPRASRLPWFGAHGQHSSL